MSVSDAIHILVVDHGQRCVPCCAARSRLKATGSRAGDRFDEIEVPRASGATDQSANAIR